MNQGNYMDDVKQRLERIEQQGVKAQIATEVQKATYAAHEVQNAKDFKHVDECLHRTEESSVKRDEATLEVVKEIRAQLEEVKKLVWRSVGALLVIVPVINFILNKVLS